METVTLREFYQYQKLNARTIGCHHVGSAILEFSSYAGGWLCDRLYKKGYADAPIRVGLIGAVLWIPTGVAYPLVDNGWVA